MKAYLIGIGGIGMSALARYYRAQGWQVAGYDRVATDLTKKLVSEGLTIGYSLELSEVPLDADIYIRTAAISEDQAIVAYLLGKGHKVHKRSEILGQLSGQYRCIAVAGTHGKTTTSAIIAHVLQQAGVSPTAFVGGVLRDYGTNLLIGESEWLVVEADEYDRSFLQLKPEILVWTSMDPDHLDIYGDPSQMSAAYEQLMLQIQPSGQLIHATGTEVPDSYQGVARSYGPSGDVALSDIEVLDGQWKWKIWEGAEVHEMNWNWPGEYNAMNATAAFVVSRVLGLTPQQISEGLQSFGGIQRRFERVGSNDKHTVIMDYAHHPVEIKAILTALLRQKDKPTISVVFQPHLYSRTRDFAQDFGESLDLADVIRVTEIYPAREEAIPGVDAHSIIHHMKSKDVMKIASDDILNEIDSLPPGIVLLLGAGDLDKYIERIKEKYQLQ